MSSYSVAKTSLAGHSWGIDSDYKKGLLHQKCTCGWKARIRDFDDALSLYDNAANWANHFDIKPWAER
jgi:hypothetical protein